MSLLTDFRLSVLEKNLGVYGIHVYQNGKTLAEHRFRSNDKVNLYSGSKTFSSSGIGIAEGEGRLKLSDFALDFFPEYRAIAPAGNEKITVRHLLQMSSGHMAEDYRQDDPTDRAKIFFSVEMKEEAGSHFYYENLCTYMLGRIVEKVTGETMLAYLKPRLFDPLGIVNPQWLTCPNGHTLCSTSLLLTTEEFSRVGITLLQNGVYNDKQVVPADYVARMHSDWADTSNRDDPESSGGYGYQVWKCTPEGAYRADGMYGQFSVVLPEYNAVITVTSHNENTPNDILRAMWSDILPCL